MLYVPLPTDAREALATLAREELRRPQDQAVVLLVECLERRGLLEASSGAYTCEGEVAR